MYDWRIELAEEKDEESDARATIQWDHQHRVLYITLNTTGKPTVKELKVAAFHELLEGQLSKIRELLCKYYSKDVADEEIHRIIRLLENVLYR